IHALSCRPLLRRPTGWWPKDTLGRKMADLPINDLNVASNEVMITPAQLKARIPMSDAAHATIVESRQVIRDILDGKDHRIFIVIGPCSIHDVEAAKDYARRLKALAEEVSEDRKSVVEGKRGDRAARGGARVR